jgi:hypothetical protein
MVTRLQKRGSNVINTLNPGEASQMKVDIARQMYDFLDSHLDQAAAQGDPAVIQAVQNIRDINPRYSALMNIRKAIEQRGWKEQTGAKSLAQVAGDTVKHAGTAGALGLALHGNIGPAVATAIGSYMVPPLVRAGTTGVNLGMSRLGHAADNGSLIASGIRKGVQGEVPIQPAVRAMQLTQAREAQRRREAERATSMGGL